LRSNASRVIVKPAHELDDDEWHAQLQVSLTATWRAVRAFVDLPRSSGGAIVLTSSVHALIGIPAILPTPPRRARCERSASRWPSSTAPRYG
jgi:NAD(P)-dependent dehydrogenase (short-subunit alcohol dehydrogenase family)